MLALSVRQPYAALLVTGRKPAEYRSWSTDHRGPVLIHAARVPEDVPYPGVIAAVAAIRGAIIGKVDIIDVVPAGEVRRAPGAPGRMGYAWIVDNPEVFDEPYVIRGRLGLWEAQVPLSARLTT